MKFALPLLLLSGVVLLAGCPLMGASVINSLNSVLNSVASSSDGLEFEIKDINISSYYTYTSSYSDTVYTEFAEDGFLFYIFEIDFSNNGNKSIYASSSSFIMVDDEGYALDDNKPFLGGDTLFYDKVLPGTKIKRFLVFEVESSNENPLLMHSSSSSLDEDDVFINWTINKQDYLIEGFVNAGLEVGEVDSHWSNYSNSGWISSVDYTITNSGTAPFKPRVLYSISNSSSNLASDEAYYVCSSVPGGGNCSNYVYDYTDFYSKGYYTIRLDLFNDLTDELLDSAEQEFYIG